MTARPRETPRRAGRARHRRSEPPKAPAVQIHAHRGGAGLAPENTMEAFENAAELGVHWFEFDVRTCATGELVVVHDPDLKRLGGVDARVSDLPLWDLQAIDVGSHFSAKFAGARVPTLVEVLETFRDQVRFNIEIKEDGGRTDGTATGVAELLRSMGMLADVMISSFNPLSLIRAASVVRVPLGLCYPMDDGMGLRGRVRDRVFRRPWVAPLLSAYALHPQHTLVRESMVRKAHLRGLAVNAWTVNDPARMRELAGWRVTGIITDRPDVGLQIAREVDPLARPEPGLPTS